MQFEPNRGQVAKDVAFVARAHCGAIYFAPHEIVLSTPKSKRQTRLQFVISNANVAIEAAEENAAKANYFIGNSPDAWRANVPTYRGIVYKNIYDDVDLALTGNERGLKGTYTIAPGADPARIRWRYEGAENIKIDQKGNLQIKLEGGAALTEQAPVAWQENENGRTAVAVRYRVERNKTIRFSLGHYDRSKPLIVDPTLTYSTFFGASNDDPAYKIALDCERNIYIAGYTNSIDFPTTNPIQPNKAAGYDAFVTKLSPDGATVIWSTYIGGSGAFNNGNDLLQSMTVDRDGNVYLAGNTYATDFPTVNAYQSNNKGGSDIFLTKIDPTGSTLIYSTYLGGNNFSYAFDIAVDSAGSAYVTGNTSASDFPIVGGVQSTFGGGCCDVYVTKFAPDGKSLIYSTYIGGSDIDEARAIAVDANNNAIVAGVTASLNYPLANAYQGIIGGGRDVLVTKLNSTGSQLIFSTYLGGALDEQASAMTIDRDGNVYLTGRTQSANFPTAPVGSVFQPAIGSVTDAFVSKLSANGSALVYSTFLGGVQTDYGYGIAVNDAGEAYAVGQTASLNFPQSSPIQAYGGGNDAYVAKFSAAGTGVIYSTFLGGGGDEGALSVVRDGLGSIYVTGFTRSTNYPTVNPLQPNYAGGSSDGFISKISEGLLPAPKVSSVARPESGHFILSGTAAPNAVLNIQASPDLIAPFVDIATVTAAPNGTFQFDDADAASLPKRFYRASYPCPIKY